MIGYKEFVVIVVIILKLILERDCGMPNEDGTPLNGAITAEKKKPCTSRF